MGALYGITKEAVSEKLSPEQNQGLKFLSEQIKDATSAIKASFNNGVIKVEEASLPSTPDVTTNSKATSQEIARK
ncbi:MAG: hypothetical protein WCJ33_09075 [Pseudomonadota bacterium]